MGVKIAGKHLFEEEPYWIDTVLPGYSLVVIIFALNIVRLSHPPYPDGEFQDDAGSYHFKPGWIILKMKKHPKVWAFRAVIIIIMSIMPLLVQNVNAGFILIVIFFCVFALQFADIEGKNQRRKQKEELKEKRDAAKQNIDPMDRLNTLKRQTVGKL